MSIQIERRQHRARRGENAFNRGKHALLTRALLRFQRRRQAPALALRHLRAGAEVPAALLRGRARPGGYILRHVLTIPAGIAKTMSV